MKMTLNHNESVISNNEKNSIKMKILLLIHLEMMEWDTIHCWEECQGNLVLAAAAAAKSLQSCQTLRPQRGQPTRLPRPWDSPGKNTGVGCHFLLQCMKVKRESEVAQPCPTPCDLMDCNLPGSSFHGVFQARVLEWVAIAFSKIQCK